MKELRQGEPPLYSEARALGSHVDESTSRSTAAAVLDPERARAPRRRHERRQSGLHVGQIYALPSSASPGLAGDGRREGGDRPWRSAASRRARSGRKTAHPENAPDESVGRVLLAAASSMRYTIRILSRADGGEPVLEQ